MSDSKTPYSQAAQLYVEAAKSEIDPKLSFEYQKSLKRKERHGEKWAKVNVNINDIVDRFAPNSHVREEGIKYIFEGDAYNVVADLATGYLRIYDNRIREYVDLKGKYQKNDDKTHFRILKKEEM